MPTIHRAEAATYRWLQERYPRVADHYTENDLIELRKKLMRSRDDLAIDLSLMRRRMLQILAEEHDYPQQPMVEEGFDLFYRLRHDVDFYPDVFPVLDQLQPHYRMGSISNGNASAGLTPLRDYFEVYVNAADVMVRKPDSRIFRAFCQNMGVAPEQCLYVGDDPWYDVEGARQAGLRTVWVNRNRQDWASDLLPADAEINDLDQLLELAGILGGSI
jgi:putative hydrolase of the HAD superfamily